MGKRSQQHLTEFQGYNSAGEIAPSLVTDIANQTDASGGAITPLATAANFDAGNGTVLAYSASGLPAGLSINASTGQITGTPTTPGVSITNVFLKTTYGVARSNGFTWTIT